MTGWVGPPGTRTYVANLSGRGIWLAEGAPTPQRFPGRGELTAGARTCQPPQGETPRELVTFDRTEPWTIEGGPSRGHCLQAPSLSLGLSTLGNGDRFDDCV